MPTDDDLIRRSDAKAAIDYADCDKGGFTKGTAKKALDSVPAAGAGESFDAEAMWQGAQVSLDEWIKSAASMLVEKPEPDQELESRVHAALAECGCSENQLNPLGALAFAKVLIDDHRQGVRTSPSRKEYYDGVKSGLDRATSVCEILAAHVQRAKMVAKIKLRNDAGPSGELSEPKEFVVVDGIFYEKDWILSAPGLRADQLDFDDADLTSRPDAER